MFDELDPAELALWAVITGGLLGLTLYLSMDSEGRRNGEVRHVGKSSDNGERVERHASPNERVRGPDGEHTRRARSRDGSKEGRADRGKPNPSGARARARSHSSPPDEHVLRARDTGRARPSSRARDVGSAPDADEDVASRRAALESAVKQAVEHVEPELRTCYQSLIDQFPAADGRVGTTFEIDSGENRVKVARIGEGTTLLDKRLHACLLSNITELSVDVPWNRHFADTGSLAIHYNFHFTPSDSDE